SGLMAADALQPMRLLRVAPRGHDRLGDDAHALRRAGDALEGDLVPQEEFVEARPAEAAERFRPAERQPIALRERTIESFRCRMILRHQIVLRLAEGLEELSHLIEET